MLFHPARTPRRPGEPEAEQSTREGLAADLTIERLEVLPLLIPLAREFRGSYYRMTARATTIARIHTRGGIVGEAYGGDEVESLGSITRIIVDEIAPRVVGETAAAPAKCWESALPVTFDILRNRREGLVALACVDAAIWDALGKALDVSCSVMWGGHHEALPAIVIAGYYGTPIEGIADEITELKELGFAGVKFKVGGAPADEDAKRLVAARAAAGDDFVIAIDANQGLRVTEALDLAERVSDLNIRWFEEPVRWQNDRRDLRDVRLRSCIAVCAGQSEFSPAGCRDLMEAGAIDVCNFDSSWSGGPTAWLRTAALAYSYSLEIAHHEEPQVALQLLGSQPHATYVECFHPDRDPVWWNLIANRPQLVNGTLSVPPGPGLGWTLDEEFVAAHRWSEIS